MILSIGWGLGQILIAMLALGVGSWRAIFMLTAIPLTLLVYFLGKNLLESPRYLVVKHEFTQAKTVISKMALMNGEPYKNEELYEEVAYNEKINGYKEAIKGGNFDSRLRHHSYLSLFRYDSIRIRVLIVGAVWSVFSLSYFISANSLINPARSLSFNIAIAGTV